MQSRVLVTLVAARVHCWLVQLPVHLGPWGLFCEAVPQLLWLQGVILFQTLDFALLLVEFQQVSVELFLQPVQVLLEGSLALKHIGCSAQTWCHLHI